MKEFKNLCTPAKIYLVVTLFLCVMSLMHDAPVLAVAIKVVFAVIWTCILSWLCKKGLSTISWILVLFPFIVILLGILGMINMENNGQQQQQQQRQQRQQLHQYQ
jgi:predicted PurR-regulated permease PerM